MKNELKLNTLIIVWLWHTTNAVCDECAFVALTRLKAWVDVALGVLERK